MNKTPDEIIFSVYPWQELFLYYNAKSKSMYRTVSKGHSSITLTWQQLLTLKYNRNIFVFVKVKNFPALSFTLPIFVWTYELNDLHEINQNKTNNSTLWTFQCPSMHHINTYKSALCNPNVISNKTCVRDAGPSKTVKMTRVLKT